ncbi:MAG: DUF4838 domain-containing protein [Clostridia bacterium]|nr:DUF4838 domain-containing protein [Clostridia bacterium]
MSRFLRLGEKLSEIYICGNDISNFSIVHHSAASLRAPAMAPENIQKAVSVLQSYIAKISDVVLPVLYDNYPLKTDFEILVGGTDREIDQTKDTVYNSDDYDIIVKKGNVIINGGKRGVLYGVYAFLEKYMGVRFFQKDVERILYRDKIEIGALKDSARPVFEYRDVCDWTMFDADFSVKSKVNGSFVRRLHAENGGGVGFAGGFDGLVHTFLRLVPPSVYYDEKPYLYALEKGVRNPGGLCMSEDETLEVVLKSAYKWLDKEEDPTLISISINDGEMAYCHCDRCEEKRKKGWNETDILYDFVNRAQKRIRRKYPGVSVETISYHDVATPPNFVFPDKDVVVRVCSTGERSIAFPDARELYLKTKDPALKTAYDYTERLKAYANFTKKIYVWDYPYSYNIINCPFPVFKTLLKNARFFAENNCKGVFTNGNVADCDFSELKVYLLSKVLFDPFMSEEEYSRCLSEFVEGYYGDGYKEVLSYIDLVEKSSVPVFYTGSFPQEIIPVGNAEKYLTEGRKLIGKAMDLAKTEGERRNLKKILLQMEYYELFVFFEEVMKGKDEEKKRDYISRNKQLHDSLRGLGMTRIVENCFLPVVRNFRQPISECSYWDLKCAAGDRNNERYARELFVIVPLPGEMGEKVDFKFSYRTNNENGGGYLGVFDGEKIVDFDLNPDWDNYSDFRDIILRGAEITDVKGFSVKSGIPLDSVYLELIPRHLKGAVLRVRSMNAGAYLFVRDPKIVDLRLNNLTK